jgi:hypothetical protein
MAFVPAGTQVISVTFEDRDVNQSTTQFFVPAAAVAADVATFARGTLVTNLAAISDASIRRVTIHQTYDNDSFVLPPETCDIERKGLFSWRASDRTRSKTEIPSIKNTLVLDKTNNILTSDPAVAAFIAMMVDTGLFDVYGMGNYRGVKLVDTITAPRKIHRGSNEG